MPIIGLDLWYPRNSKLPDEKITKVKQKAMKQMRDWKDEIILQQTKGTQCGGDRERQLRLDG